ncbi:MAG: class I SAM-dependent methyltransferase [Kiritimatiellia bacterium]
MSRGDNREKISRNRQCSYWNRLAGEYAAITRIRVDDFHYGPQIPGEKKLHLLPAFRAGQHALELGCGEGQNSIWLAGQGVSCIAMDISAQQLSYAKALAAKQGVEIDFREASLECFEAALRPGDPACFDFVHSSHAMEFVQSPGKILKAMSRRTAPGGIVVVSTVHPLYNGEWIEDGELETLDDGETEDAGSGLFLPNYFCPPDDIREDSNGHVVSRAWPVSAWFGWFRAAGLEVVGLAEPPACKNAPYTSDDWAHHGGQLDCIPSTLILVGRKPLS